MPLHTCDWIDIHIRPVDSSFRKRGLWLGLPDFPACDRLSWLHSRFWSIHESVSPRKLSKVNIHLAVCIYQTVWKLSAQNRPLRHDIHLWSRSGLHTIGYFKSIRSDRHKKYNCQSDLLLHEVDWWFSRAWLAHSWDRSGQLYGHAVWWLLLECWYRWCHDWLVY